MVRAFAHGAMGRRIDPSWGEARCNSVVRAFAHGAMGRRIDPSWGGGGGARCSSVVRAFAHGAMGRLIDPSWWTHELFLVPASTPRLVTKAVVCVFLSVGWCI